MLELSLKKRLPGFHVDIELALDEELLVLFGPSGAGKTMILKMISGIVAPDEGRVASGPVTLFDSRRGVNVPIRNRKVGYLFQDYALFPHMTVRENIAYAIDGDGSQKVKELLSVMRLTGLEERFPHELSGGQKQRTALARTLAAEPRVLLLDEPFSALDYQVREKLRADLLNIHRIYPMTTVLVTHDLEEAFMLGKRVAVINNGSIEQVGTQEDVFYRPATRNVARFMGVRNIFSGVVACIEGGNIVIDTPDIGMIKAPARAGADPAPGVEVTFCIRPEEILVIRPDRVLGRVQDNILECEIIGTIGKGSTHILYLEAGEGRTPLKAELPNFVLRKLELAVGRSIRVSLKKENIWVIP
ncbi:MAG TPA: ABC transporter ATP-binding protein [Deltaproteobacteria bacterium]|nr:MAG: hypothetical protein A2Z79_03860 [Deltaproteobacteria bacterium GWA2_55_82]OGQ64066.1 MAG: hypothetical protein A3I81_10235 [Deltaproteobacteria bacterium RIFCSPLOWO2_02_FULL_55_12]OIJ74516.1 MAG: hypothetical protein A2V21_309760 [Deltaproteobacteria bacterium GWC2_55_46]HBG47179.1 ABC transporter ATP-binding protein [Deltaproteobacteria bacterium]HCY10759.1 ABC transporter ATP-binding protein [Deltaproteobacteria bacterium]